MKLNAILKLHNLGLSLFPVSLDTKIPMVKWARLQTERPTQAEIVEWFTPNGRAVGVACGPVSGIFMLDFDFRKHPEARKFFQSHSWPRTWTEVTRSGGLHFYFRWSDTLGTRKTNTQSVLAPGVDTKGAGGYSKMAPSLGYRWTRSPHLTRLADAPAWLVALLQTRENRSLSSAGWIANTVKNMKDGSRAVDFLSLAGSLRARGYTPDEIFIFLSGPARDNDFSEERLRKVCDDASRWPVADGFAEGDDGISAFLADKEEVFWLCEPFIPSRSIGFIAGLPETMKTWIAMDLAIECARPDGNWLGKFPTRRARTLFIDQERFRGETQRRFQALIAGKGLDVKVLDLHVRCDSTMQIDEPLAFERFKKHLTTIRPELIVIDSFATFHRGYESDRSDIQPFFERVKQIRREFGCAVVFIDHENKMAFQDKEDKTSPTAMRIVGSVGKVAAAEFALTVRRQDFQSSFVYHTKSTMATAGAPFLVTVKDLTPERDRITVEAV